MVQISLKQTSQAVHFFTIVSEFSIQSLMLCLFYSADQKSFNEMQLYPLMEMNLLYILIEN